MSLTNSDRNIQTKIGKYFPSKEEFEKIKGLALSEAIAEMLQLEFGDNQGMIKSIMSCTGANERTVKNWLAGKNAPSGRNLILLMQKSGIVLTYILHLTGHEELLRSKLHDDIYDALKQCLKTMDNLKSDHITSKHHQD